MKDCLIVLDSFEYKGREQELEEYLGKDILPLFFYSKYENGLTELFQKTKIVGGFLTHISYWFLSLGYVWQLLGGKYSRHKNIIFINPIVGIFYCLLSRIFLIDKNLSIAGFLFENKRNKIYLSLRKAFVNFSYKKANHIFVYGENEVEFYNSIFPKLKGKFKYVKYGRDFLYKDQKIFKYDKPYFASGGRSNRKFDTLCSAMQILKDRGVDIDCLIATRPECVTAKIVNSPVKFQYGITLNQFGSFIEHSSLFILPLLDTKLSAGHMAMMEAMAKSKPIIVTDIPAIRDYVSEKHVIFYKPDNENDLANKIQYVMTRLDTSQIRNKIKGGKELYIKEYSFKALLKRIITKSLG